MINALAGKLDAGGQILRFQIGQLRQNLFGGKACGEQIEDIDNTNPHAADTGASAT